MEGLAITSKGMEDITAKEIEELIGAKSEIKEGCVVFKIKDIKELCLLAYKAQSVSRILYLIKSLNADNDFVNNAVEAFKKTELGDWLDDAQYDIKCMREWNDNFSSADVEKQLKKSLAGYFNEKYGSNMDFENPKILMLVYLINNRGYVGIDIAGLELQKRNYKIFMHGGSLRATIAYALLRLSGFEEGDVLLDPFTGDGVIAIEAALYASGFPVNYYSKNKFLFSKFNFFDNPDAGSFLSKFDKKPETKSLIYSYGFLFKYVDYAKKNAKIAGVHDIIKLSRVEIGWLDVKFSEKSVDRIVTKMPVIKSSPEKKINEFFYQCRYVLKDAGAIALITFSEDIVKNCAAKNQFELSHERSVYSGQQSIKLLVFRKAKQE